MQHRIVGLETEFGCLVRDTALGSYETVVEQVKEAIFARGQWGLLDLHTRDMYFEPAEAGGFLINGGRLYIDAVGTHLEYATPECRSLRDLIAYERAGQRLIAKTLRALRWHERVSFYNNSVDHFAGHTFGCHENYSVNVEALSWRQALEKLVPFLVTRQIFAGAGRAGGHRLTSDWQRLSQQRTRHPADYVFVDAAYSVEPDPTVDFQLSQRADHILHTVSGRVRFSRALINPKWDQMYELSRSPRLHLLFGEANPSEYATFLKTGTTVLVLDLLEERAVPLGVELVQPLKAMKEISRDPTWRWLVRRENGQTISAIDLQRIYLQAAQERFAGRDAETDEVLREWERTLDALERDPLTLSDRLDWVAKYKLLQLYQEAEGLSWQSEAIHSLDLEYHNVDPEYGLHYALEDRLRLVSDRAILRAIEDPPVDTRAYGRAMIVRGLRTRGKHEYMIEWDGVFVEPKKTLVLANPFHTYEEEAEVFLKRL
ncbi:MAG: proteasome accessory factor PafA2 family protein [Candidatus Bipolaricaulota bacterium]|nr:proteasome accessory factor PafA2 family protein [Candidatus Bipolaricaulota bacterium]MDW8140782.1 proteasome accessory factor PafA2 family protein [Candidatus Bipolaricaulota bacterium]